MELRCEVDGRVYYPVIMETNPKTNKPRQVIRLPHDEDPSEYIIEVATVEVRKHLGTTLAAEKRQPVSEREAEAWSDHSGRLNL